MFQDIHHEAENTMRAFTNYLQEFFDRPGAPTQSIIAARVGIHRVNLNRIVKGHAVPSLDKAELIAVATGTTLSRILKNSEKRELVSA